MTCAKENTRYGLVFLLHLVLPLNGPQLYNSFVFKHYKTHVDEIIQTSGKDSALDNRHGRRLAIHFTWGRQARKLEEKSLLK